SLSEIRALGWVAFTIVYVSASVGNVAAAKTKQPNVTRILEATYGGGWSCKGNVTRFVAWAAMAPISATRARDVRTGNRTTFASCIVFLKDNPPGDRARRKARSTQD